MVSGVVFRGRQNNDPPSRPGDSILGVARLADRFCESADGAIHLSLWEDLDVATILVVDDDPLVRRMLSVLLNREGFEVLTAGNGAEALRATHARTSEVDLLISDVEMPEIGGPQLAAELRADHPDLPVLLISGSCRCPSPAASGSLCILPKPLDVAVLLTTVRQLLARRTAHVTA